MKTLTSDEIVAVAELTCEQAGLSLPTITIKKIHGGGYNTLTGIRLPAWLLDRPEPYAIYYVCHELAHLRFLRHNSDFKRFEQVLCAMWGVRITGYSRGVTGRKGRTYPKASEIVIQ